MKKRFIGFLAFLLMVLSLPVGAFAASESAAYTVVRGDTLWKIAVRYQVGVSEIISANPQLSDPDKIYPGQTVYIPALDSTVASYEQQVVDLVNEIRVKNGLGKLTANWELSRVARYKSQDMHDSGYFSHTS